MAVTADQVMVRMTADTSQYQKGMNAATQSATRFDLKSTTAIKNLDYSFKALGTTSIKMSQDVHKALENMAQTRGLVKLEQQIDAVIAKQRQMSSAFSGGGGAMSGGASPIPKNIIPPKAQQDVHQFNNNIGIMAAQLQDIGVTAAAGMNPMLIALQQGTQISAILAGQGGGGLAAVRAAFMSVISPASLLTIALVAGSAALIQWAMNAYQAASGTGDFEKEMKNLNDVTEAYVDAVKLSSMGIEELKSQYGHLADEVRLASKEMVYFTGVQAKAAVITSARQLSKQLGMDLNPVQAPVEWSGNVNQDRQRLVNKQVQDDMDELRRKTGATVDQIDRLRLALNRTNSANSLDAVIKDSSNLLEIVGDLAQNPGADQTFLAEWAERISSVMKVAQDQMAATMEVENDLIATYDANTDKLKGLADDRENAEKLLTEAQKTNNADRIELFEGIIRAIDQEIDKTKQLARESDVAYKAMARAYKEYADSRRAGNEWANSAEGFEAQYVAQRASGAGSDLEELVRAVSALAEQMGLSAKDLLAVMSFETGGQLRPDTMGGVTSQGQHFGLIQFGDKGSGPRYGVTPNSTITEQVIAAGRYLQDAGVKAGDSLANIYAAVLSGDARKVNASDLAAGGVVGNVTQATGGSQFAGHKNRAEGLLAAFGGPAKEAEEEVKANEREKTELLRDQVRERERLAKQVKEYGQEIAKNLVTEEKRTELEKVRSQQIQAIKAAGMSEADEAAAIAMVNAEMEKQLTIYALMEEAKQRQVDLDTLMVNSNLTYRQAIEALGEAKRKNVVQTQELARAEELAGQKAEFARTMQDTFTNGLLDAIVAGESFSDVLANLALMFARASLQAALFNQGPYASGSGTGLIGGIVNAAFGGFRAAGGPVQPGKAYIVGEKGPEVWTPGVSGNILPNSVLGKAETAHMGAGIGSNTLRASFAPNITLNPGVTQKDLAMAMMVAREEYTNNFLGMLRKEMPNYTMRYG